MRKLLSLYIFFLIFLNNCSFDNKTGIWKGHNKNIIENAKSENKTEKLLIDLFKEKIEKIYNSKSFYDSKSLLQEKLQEEGIDLPDYVSSELEDGNFNVDLFIQNKLITSTKARRKIDAEKSAAQIALDTFINKDEK